MLKVGVCLNHPGCCNPRTCALTCVWLLCQSKSLYSVRAAFKLMQNDLDPLLQGMLLCTERQHAYGQQCICKLECRDTTSRRWGCRCLATFRRGTWQACSMYLCAHICERRIGVTYCEVYLGSFAQGLLTGHGLVTHSNDPDVMLYRYTSDNAAHRAATGGSSKGGGHDHAGPDAHS